jgi:hypothetical protein
MGEVVDRIDAIWPASSFLGNTPDILPFFNALGARFLAILPNLPQ